MKYYACGAAMAGMVALAATAASWAQTPASSNPPADAATKPATPAAAPNQPAQTPPTDKPQALATSPVCPPTPVHRHVAYHRRVHSTVGSSAMTASYNTAELVETAPPPAPVYYAPPPPPPIWYGPVVRPWFPGPWHYWGRPRW